ncbi:MAG: hypothetical protein ACYC36_02460 [Bellilinea sp.]
MEDQTSHDQATSEDPNNNGGLPVMTEETIAEAVPPSPEELPEPKIYTLLDNGEYQPILDVIYPPGTQFYCKDGDEYVALPAEEVAAPQDIQDMTTEHILGSAIAFLTQHGYTVTAPGADGPDTALPEIKSSGKDLIAQEIGDMLNKLRQLFNAHASTHAAVLEAHNLIAGIESHL